MNSVMARLPVVFGVYAAACDDGDIGIFSDVKIVVY